MKFRPCIDLHEGIVKQIVGSTLSENDHEKPQENFVSNRSAGDFARMYKEDRLTGGHVIMLGKNCSEAAFESLREYPQGLQIGGGINLDNAMEYVNAGASHVIVTSYVFNEGNIDFQRLQALSQLIGRDRLVIDLSCRRNRELNDELFYVVTNKWTKYTSFPVTIENLTMLSTYCSEFLVHGVDVEGKRAGIEEDLVVLLGQFAESSGVPVTYAGGVRSLDDMELVRRLGHDHVDCTIGSALDCFGGDLSYDLVLQWHRSQPSNQS